jgi:hypothetical protein
MLVSVISWIVLLPDRKTDDPRTHTNGHEMNPYQLFKALQFNLDKQQTIALGLPALPISCDR